MMVHRSEDLAPFIILAHKTAAGQTKQLLLKAIDRVTQFSHLAQGEDRTMIQREIQALLKLKRELYPGE